MKQSIICRWLLLLVAGMALNLSAQGTTFSYQGRLNDNGNPASGAYDLRFALYDAATNGNAISSAQTNFAVPVTGGLFTTNLNFGPVFAGSNYWLAIGVRTNGNTNAFTFLQPRQPLLPVPYAIFANTASNLLGTLSAAQLTSGTLADARLSTNVSQLNQSQIFSGTNNFTNGANTFYGTFSGNGLLLTNLNATMLSTGTVADARLSTNVALLNRSSLFTATNNFTNGANSFSGTFFGNGTNLSNLNASQLTGGTLADARLTPNVPLLNRDQAFTGLNTFSNPTNSFTGNFFGNGLVGWIPVSGVSTQAIRDAGYLMLNASLSSVTLPANASLFVSDIVRVSGGGAGGWLAKVNAGQTIAGNLAAYRNGYLVSLPGLTTDAHGVAASADGVRMYAVGNGLTGVYASSDSGRTWNQVSGVLLSGTWYSVACSADGKIVYAEPYAGGIIQKSTNSGATWANTATSATAKAIACTADGATLFASDIACSGNGTYLARLSGGVVQISSTGSGGPWNNVAAAPAAGVTCLGASSDCTRLVAGVSNGLLYASSNLGATWTTLTTTSQKWSGAWMSPDGSKFAATVLLVGGVDGGVYGCNVSPLPNTSCTTSTGSIGGSQGSAVELQYLGSGQFMPVSSTGIIWAN